ncbi:uncharacterized protein LOC144927089 [Branchiostoma floridae x Branchiostoma belcheri]
MTTAGGTDSDIYMAFYRHDFENDRRFQDGFRKILSAEKTSQDHEEILRAKVFYFNKFYRPSSEHSCIDVDGLKKWLDAEGLKGMECPPPLKNGEIEDEKSNAEARSGMDEKRRVATGNATSTEEETAGQPSYPTSFADIVQCIQEGREIPGIEKLDIQPINCEPTLSTQTRPPKPWESRTST